MKQNITDYTVFEVENRRTERFGLSLAQLVKRFYFREISRDLVFVIRVANEEETVTPQTPENSAKWLNIQNICKAFCEINNILNDE